MSMKIEDQERAIEQINNFIKQWTQKYIYFTTYYGFDLHHGETFETIFSHPQKAKPIPIAIIKVYFYMNIIEDDRDKPFDLKFRFENDSLIHKPSATLRIAQMERWLENILYKKSQTTKIMFLGTQFEQTRIKDVRLDQIIDSMNQRETKTETKYLSNTLLSNENELQEEKDYGNEAQQLETLRTSLFNVFRTIDNNDFGVLSVPEIKMVFESMKIDLEPNQWEELLTACDTKKTGLVKYEELMSLGTEFIFGAFLKNQSIKQLNQRENEFLLQAIFILHNDEIHTVANQILTICEENDIEDQTEIIAIEKLKELMADYDTFTSAEKEEFFDTIKKNYPDDDFPYKHIYTLLLEIRNLKNGLMESSINDLEKYIRSLCEPFDPIKKGMCKTTDFILSLERSNQIVLTKVQTYIIRSFIDQNEQGTFNYLIGSRHISSIIKSFFTPFLIEKKQSFLDMANVRDTDRMEGWTEKEIKQDLEDLFIKYTAKGQEKMEVKDLKKMMRDIKHKVSDNELNYILETRCKTETDKIYLQEFKENFYDFLKIYRCNLALAKLETI